MKTIEQIRAEFLASLPDFDGDIDSAADAMHVAGYSEEIIEAVVRPIERERREIEEVQARYGAIGESPRFRPFEKHDWNAYAGATGEPVIATLLVREGAGLRPYDAIAVYDDGGLRIELHSAEGEGFYAEGASVLRALAALRQGMPLADVETLFRRF